MKAAPSEQTTDDALAKLEGIKWDDELGVEDAPKIRDAFAAVVAELKHQRAELAEQKTFRGTLQQQQAQDAAQQSRTKAVESLHALGHKDLFGEPGGEPTAAQRANIEKALERTTSMPGDCWPAAQAGSDTRLPPFRRESGFRRQT